MERLQNKNRVAGIKQVKKAILAQKAEAVFIAKDCDLYIIEEMENLCSENEVFVVYAETMKELAKACRVEVPTAVAATVKE
ncbi:MAG: 50S ribosomal protein L7ae-like protein [Ruminococcaceae bacterium]|nr:50S ribosomal protein L7ae-like protein [Oscillospiraceae bacterium]